ncbi:MAG TPA: prepilin-type N-terminal cleavage/methylation domain-containing protein [Candidatus Woesebacteria bacterium]|nr:prepilin-type N-terminal cleavage/methylation domain-containing protein [Candidatus Woesebacteria bacterium]
MIKKQHHLSGFTLVELLVVISILVIIGLMILIGVNPLAQIHKAYDARRKADISRIQKGMESYYADHENYPSFPIKDADDHFTYPCGSDVLSPYVESMPCDPTTKRSYTIWLIPKGSTSPSKYAIIAESDSFFDSQSTDNEYISESTSNPYCPGLFIVSSPDMTDAEIIEGCSGLGLATKFYGCVDSACKPIQAGSCAPNYDTVNCGRNSAAEASSWCSLPANACQ